MKNTKEEQKFLAEKLIDGTLELIRTVSDEMRSANLESGHVFVTVSKNHLKALYIDNYNVVAEKEVII